MLKITYTSAKEFLYTIVQAFREYTPESRSDQEATDDSEGLYIHEDSVRAKFRVSVNDLKIISSALLHYKKFLMKRKDYEKAETVGEVDERIYQLILNLEKTKNKELVDAEQVAA